MGLSFSQVGNSDAGKTMSAFAQWAGVEIGKFFPKNPRLARILEKGGIATVRDLVIKTESELLAIHGIADASVEKVRERLAEEQLHLGYDETEELRAENARLRKQLAELPELSARLQRIASQLEQAVDDRCNLEKCANEQADTINRLRAENKQLRLEENVASGMRYEIQKDRDRLYDLTEAQERVIDALNQLAVLKGRND